MSNFPPFEVGSETQLQVGDIIELFDYRSGYCGCT